MDQAERWQACQNEFKDQGERIASLETTVLLTLEAQKERDKKFDKALEALQVEDKKITALKNKIIGFATGGGFMGGGAIMGIVKLLGGG